MQNFCQEIGINGEEYVYIIEVCKEYNNTKKLGEISKQTKTKQSKEFEQEISCESNKTKNESRLDNLIDEFLNMNKPIKEIIRAFIEKIEIHSDKQVNIYFNFKSLQEMSEKFNFI